MLIKQVIRRSVKLCDVEQIQELVKSARNFSEQEIDVARDLVSENILKGSKKSGYYFSIMENDGAITGYACYGPTPFTNSVYNLYWIVVDPKYRRQNIARRLLSDAEEVVKKLGGDTIYTDTSSRSDYSRARFFYLKNGFVLCSEYTDFYSKGDSKLVFKKILCNTCNTGSGTET